MKKTLLRHVRHLLLIVLSTLSLAVGLAGLTLKSAHAATRVPSVDTCYGASCYNQDPVTFGCLDSYIISPENKLEYYGGIIVGSFSVVYSYTCNATWVQATLDPFAINQGYRVLTAIRTDDSQTPSQDELICYPDDCYNDHPIGYGGETGWPTYSNMVDGTNTTYSAFGLVLPDGTNTNIDIVTQNNGVG